MNTDEFRGSLSLDEVQKIIKISHHLEFPYTTKDEWIIDEFEYLLRGFGNLEKYAATLPSVIVITLLVILIVLIIPIKNKSKK